MFRARIFCHVAVTLQLHLLAGCTTEGVEYDVIWSTISDSSETRAIAEGADLCTSQCFHLQQVALIGDTAGPGYIVGSTYVVRDSLHRYWAGQREEIKVFASDGRYITTVGRSGRGPMEFNDAQPVQTDPAGNVHIFDSGNRRETVFTEDLSLLAERSLPPIGTIQDVAPIPGTDRYIVNMWATTAEQLGLPLHIISGPQIFQSFGASEATGPLDAFRSLRLVEVDSAQRFFSTSLYEYNLEVWTPSGRRILGLAGPILNTAEIAVVPNLGANPIPNKIMDIETNDAGELWVLLRLVRENWRAHMTEVTLPNGTVALQLRSGSIQDSIYVNRLDVIDLATGSMLAKQELSGRFYRLLGDGLALEGRERENGAPQIAIWHVSFSSADRN